MKPIYCFIIDKKTGELTRLEITNYNHSHVGNTLYYKRGKSIKYIKPDDIDTYKNGRVYTYNSDVGAALTIMTNSVQASIKSLRTKINNYEHTYQQVCNARSSCNYITLDGRGDTI